MSSFVDYDSYGAVGFTDIVSNTVVLDDIEPLARRAEIVEGKLDLKFLPGIAHEAAHHVCLDTPVGNALCSLWQSSFSLWWEQAGQNVPQLPARDLAVARTVNILLQPLFEGLALFCEHDLQTADTAVISNVTLHVAPLFSRGRILPFFSENRDFLKRIMTEGLDQFSVGHSEILKSARTTKEWAEGKQLLLGQPLNEANRYLLGYLAVKSMYCTLAGSYPKLADPELFFVTVVQHILHDKPLLEILLRLRNKADSPQEAYLAFNQDLSDVFTRFQDLLDELYKFPARAAKNATDKCLGQSRESRTVSAFDLYAAHRTIGTLNIAWPKLMKHRKEFRFSFQPVVIRLREDGTAVVSDTHDQTKLLEIQTIRACRPIDWTPGESDLAFEGSIEAVQLRDFKTFVVCIFGHDGLVALFDCKTGDWNPQDLVDRLDDMPSAIAVEGAMNVFNEWQSRTKRSGDVKEAIEFAEKQAHGAVDEIYPQLVCHGSKLNEISAVVSAFDPQGFFSIYQPEDHNLIARLSLAAGLFNSLANVAEVLEMDLEELVAHVQRINEISMKACGFLPFLSTDGHIISRI